MSYMWKGWPTVIGVTGRAQHGKDSIVSHLRKYHYERVAFADALKELARWVDPIVETYPWPRTLSAVIEEEGAEAAKQLPEVRRIYQELGTGAREILGDDVWTRAVHNRIVEAKSDGHGLAVSDVRFPNEADLVKFHDGILIRVERPGFDNGVDLEHPSEKYVEYLPADYVIVNDGDLAMLHYKVDNVLALATGAVFR